MSANTQDTKETILEIVYYTDPLCCWSWAFEPQWRRLRYEFGDNIKWRYCMGGLLPDWQSFNDPMNSVSHPVQMGPLWFEAKHISGMPVNEMIWMEDPPASSYPACIAVKCMELQSAQAAEKYLRSLREAVMLQKKNIARQEVLLELATDLAESDKDLFNRTKFEEDLKSGAGQQPFREDLQMVRYHKIGRFPTLTIKRKDGKGVIITGYRPYKVLLEAIAAIAPELKPTKDEIAAEEYSRYWGAVTDRELAEV